MRTKRRPAQKQVTTTVLLGAAQRQLDNVIAVADQLLAVRLKLLHLLLETDHSLDHLSLHHLNRIGLERGD